MANRRRQIGDVRQQTADGRQQTLTRSTTDEQEEITGLLLVAVTVTGMFLHAYAYAWVIE